MPSVVSEVGDGAQFSRSSDDGQVADTLTRTFRIVLSSPSEFVDIQTACGVRIGDAHPSGVNLFCVSFDARFEGDSRMVMRATFNYRSSPGREEPKKEPPPTRPANWSTSTSLMEVPKSKWRQRVTATTWSSEVSATTPAGDMYDGITALEAVVTIKIDQWEDSDPTKFNLYAGAVNSDTLVLGSLTMTPGTVMYRGVTSQPALESWGDQVYRGWRCSHEFAYRRNRTNVYVSSGGNAAPAEVDIGWDIAVVMSGYNVKAFGPGTAQADEDVYAQPLKFEGEKLADPLSLPDNVSAGDRVRAQVRIPGLREGAALQTPSASPVALKPNGRPLKTHDASGALINDPYVYAYRTQPAINMKTTLGLRLT